MKIVLCIVLLVHLTANVHTQTIIKMEKINGVYVMPCTVNGLGLKFIFDTGASDVSISLTEALFMIKNGYLSEDDLTGTEYYRIANGDIEEGTSIVLKTVEIGKLKLYNVKASVVHTLSAPLLLGQSALSKLGKIEFDYAQSTLTIKSGPSDYIQAQTEKASPPTYQTQTSKESTYTGAHKFSTTFDNPMFELPLRSGPSLDAREVYKCPKNATIYVIDNTGKMYFKVYVNGYTGYLSKTWLKRQW